MKYVHAQMNVNENVFINEIITIALKQCDTTSNSKATFQSKENNNDKNDFTTMKQQYTKKSNGNIQLLCVCTFFSKWKQIFMYSSCLYFVRCHRHFVCLLVLSHLWNAFRPFSTYIVSIYYLYLLKNIFHRTKFVKVLLLFQYLNRIPLAESLCV